MATRYSRRRFMGYGASAALAASAWVSRARAGGTTGPTERVTPTRAGSGSGALPPIEGAELVTDPAQFPTAFAERPEFAAMVEAGTLPPVAERIGQDPLVLSPLHGIGVYGGTIRRGFLGVGDNQNANRFCSGPDNLLYWDNARESVIPNIARDFEVSDDAQELILHLRRGMRWSDGEPFTADDIVFWRNDISLNPELTRGSPSLRVGGEEVAVERIDDVTVRFVSTAPHPLLPALMASASDIAGHAANNGLANVGLFAPKHYLSQFHPAYASQDEVDRLATDAGFNGWVQYFQNRNSWELNPDLPTVTPWTVTRPINDPPWEFFANPYSIWVDTDGNQLPYIGEITMGLAEERELITLRATSGDFDFQDRHLAVASLPTLLENQERGGYTLHRTPQEEMDFGMRVNLAYDADAVLGELIRTVDFRRALSMGIDRDQINEAFFLGQSVPTATMASDSSPYFPGGEWRSMWATHDPEQANGLLDGIGLTDKDGSGFRQRPDGGGRITLDYQCGAGFADFLGCGEMIKQQWTEIGIDVTVEQIETTLLTERIVANALMLQGGQPGTDDPLIKPEAFLPTNASVFSTIGIPYAQWFASDGTDGIEPPESLQALKDAMDLYYEGLETVDEARRIEISQELYRLHADQVWSIGCVGFGMGIYGMYLASGRLRNVPARVLNTIHQRSPTNARPMTFFFEQ